MNSMFNTVSRFVATALPAQGELEDAISAPVVETVWEPVGQSAQSGFTTEEGRYYLKSLAGQESLPIPPSELKNFSIWCPYEGDKDKTMELFQSLMKDVEAEMVKEDEKAREKEAAAEGDAGKAGTSEDKNARREIAFQRVLIKALQLTSDRKEPWCRVSSNQSSPWGSVEDSSQLNPPAFTLTNSMWDRDSVAFCESQSRWLEGIQTVVPQQVEAMIIREWEKNGGRTQDEAKTAEFRKSLDNCLNSLNIYYNPIDGVYNVSQDPKSLCLQALDMVLPDKATEAQAQASNWSWFPTTTDKPKGPREEIEQYMNSYLLNMPWGSWVQKFSFCEPMVNANFWVKLFYNTAGSIVTWGIGIYTSLALAVSFVAQRLGAALTAWGLTKLIFTPWNWPKTFKAAKDFFKNKNKKGPKDPPPPPAPAAEPAKKTAPAEDKKSELLVDDTAQKVGFTALAGYALYKFGKIALDMSRFAAPAAALIPFTPDMPVWKCGAMNSDETGCAEWRMEQQYRARTRIY